MRRGSGAWSAFADDLKQGFGGVDPVPIIHRPSLFRPAAVAGQTAPMRRGRCHRSKNGSCFVGFKEKQNRLPSIWAPGPRPRCVRMQDLLMQTIPDIV